MEKPVIASAAESIKICNGVFIDEVDVSGMNKAEAEAAVGNYLDGLKNKGLAITVGENVVYETLGDIDYTADPEESIKQALDFGKTGNLIKRYKDLKDIEQGSVKLPLKFSYDKNKIQEIVDKDVSAYNVAPVNASVAIKNGKLVYTNHKVGSKVNVKETAKLIAKAVDSWNRQDIIVDAVIDESIPKYTKDIVEQCNTILGSYTTEYTSSAEGRAANLANGARLINNAVIYPNEEFNAYKFLSPFTQENGYFVAGAYLKGKVIDSVGGGACQVTTTLYNAVLFAELEVTQRQNHSMVISYVDLSRDAAIAGTSKNFKFKNNTDVPILIQASTQDRRITFKIWGHETRNTKNRKIKYVTKVLSKTAPPKDDVTKDPTMPTTYHIVTTPAHVGYKAELYKVVYENGVEVSRTIVNKSNYQPAARCITVGTKVIKEDTTDQDQTDGTTTDTGKPDTNTKKNDATKSNGNTKPGNTSSTDGTADTDTQAVSGDDTYDEIQSQSVPQDNIIKPEDRIQDDIWDPTR
jgi:Uncharacterized vancomycin resistance protein